MVGYQKWVQEDIVSLYTFCTSILFVLWQQLPKEVSIRVDTPKNLELLLGRKSKDSTAT
jgi:hypothetical protein